MFHKLNYAQFSIEFCFTLIIGLADFIHKLFPTYLKNQAV